MSTIYVGKKLTKNTDLHYDMDMDFNFHDHHINTTNQINISHEFAPDFDMNYGLIFDTEKTTLSYVENEIYLRKMFLGTFCLEGGFNVKKRMDEPLAKSTRISFTTYLSDSTKITASYNSKSNDYSIGASHKF